MQVLGRGCCEGLVAITLVLQLAEVTMREQQVAAYCSKVLFMQHSMFLVRVIKTNFLSIYTIHMALADLLSRILINTPLVAQATPITSYQVRPFVFEKLSTKHGTVLWLDGGQSLLFDAVQVAIGYIRIATIQAQTISYNYVCVIQKQLDSFAIHLLAQDDVTTTFDKTHQRSAVFVKDVPFTSLGETTPQSALSYVRRTLELFFASVLAKEQKLTCIVLDGTLKVKDDVQQQYVNQLSKYPVAAVSKSCRLQLVSGHSITTYVASQPGAVFASQVYLAQTQTHQASISFIKAHEQSKLALRVDTPVGCDIVSVVSQVAFYCYDSQFKGYPYPLVRVDEAARVTDEQKELLKTAIFSQLPVHVQEAFMADTASVSMHDVLDHARF
jgi:hypothetical protein